MLRAPGYKTLYILLLGLFFQTCIFAQTTLFDSTFVTAKFNKTPLHEALQELQGQIPYNFVYSNRLVENIVVDSDFDNAPLPLVLNSLFRGTPILHKVLNKQIILVEKPLTTQNYDVKGYVFDAVSKEPLPYANIYLSDSRIGATSNTEGYFILLNIPAGLQELTIEYIGYKTQLFDLNVAVPPPLLTIEMQPNLIRGQDVTITEKNSANIQLSGPDRELRLSPRALFKIPAVGDEDIFRALQLLPGIKTSGDGSSGLHIRGGTPDQNLILFDGMTIYHTDHFLGFLSAFNTAAIKDVRVFRGGFPAKYGGRTSGVIELTGKAGNPEKFNGSIGFNLLSANSHATIPIAGKGALSLSFRRAYTDIVKSGAYNNIVGLFFNEDNDAATTYSNNGELISLSPKMYFYDFNSKLSFSPTRSDNIAISFYSGRDNLNISETVSILSNISDTTSTILDINERIKWGNVGYSLKWSRIWNPRFYTNFIAARSEFISRFNEDLLVDGADSTSIPISFRDDNKVESRNLTIDNDWHISTNNRLGFGISLNWSGIDYDYTQSDTLNVLEERLSAFQGDFYVQSNLNFWQRLDLNLGVRSTFYELQEKFYWEPRLSFVYSILPSFTFQGSWGLYHQFVKNIVNDDLLQRRQGFWLPADASLTPEFARHFSAGLGYETEQYHIAVDGYYRNMTGLHRFSLQFVENDSDFDRPELFLQGNAEAKGIEFFAQRKGQHFSGWASYTISKTSNRFPTLNDGNPFPANNDQKYEFKVAGQYLYRNWHFGANWVFASGRPHNAPESQYLIAYLDGTVRRNFYLGELNGDRLADYHRLDLSVFYRIEKQSPKAEIGLSVFNVYNRSNTWFRKYNLFTTPVSVRNINMLGITPNVSFKLFF